MAGIFGLLGLEDNSRAFVSTLGQQVVMDAITTWFNRINIEMEAAMAVFVDEVTEIYKERYFLPGGGYLQKRGIASQPGAVKASGYWDTAYPMEDYGAQIAQSDVALAYMTAQDLNRHILTVTAQNTNTVRYEILKALFNNRSSTSWTYVDPIWGSLSIWPLANGDANTLYPPVIGSSTEATENHYLESGYAAASISDSNNPVATIVEDLEHHFGMATGGANIVVFINTAQVGQIGALTDFIEVPDTFIRTGSNTDVPQNLPGVPGRVIGRCSGAWIVEWLYIPANYMVGIHLEMPKPLKMRVDPSDTGLGRGLQLVARDIQYPLEAAFYRNRFGIGAANRLNGVVMELGTGGTYDVPAAYA